MSLRGTVRNGKIELEGGEKLPDGTKVRIEPIRTPRRSGAKAGSSPLRLSDLAVPMGVSDLAAEHDHYLYGTPKRSKSKRSPATKARSRKRAG